MPRKGQKIGEHSDNRKGKERPHQWITGPDPLIHDMYNTWLKRKAQANFRKEGWKLTFEDFQELWEGKWESKGRKPDDLCMTRIDFGIPWTKANTEVIGRYEQLVRQAAMRVEKNRRKRNV